MNLKTFLLCLMFALFGCNQSDETILRKEFDIPENAQLLNYKASPEVAGWFGREGLKIDMVFQFDDKTFTAYRLNAERSGTWYPLPIHSSFLMKMGGIASAKQRLLRSYALNQEQLPKEGSVYNPSEQQLYANFVKSLPLTAKNGLFQCKTAGDNILFNQKKILNSELTEDLNDFMLAILDFDKQTLSIKVSTHY